MKYHLTKEETWMRCRAEKRTGQRVSLCPIGIRSHVVGRHGIAAHGGGIESRTENGERIEISISPIGADETFTATSPKGFRRVYLATGELVKLRDRAKPKVAQSPKLTKEEKIAKVSKHPSAQRVNEAYRNATAITEDSKLKQREKVALLLEASNDLLDLNGYQEPNEVLELHTAAATLWKMSEDLKLPKTTQKALHENYLNILSAHGRKGLPLLPTT